MVCDGCFCWHVTVDASQAGEGQLEISINNGRVPNKVEVLGGGKCLVTFTPQNAQPHFIDVKFNSEQVPGCPIQCSVFDTSRISASGPGLERVCVGRAAKFVINTAGAGESEVKVTIMCKWNYQEIVWELGSFVKSQQRLLSIESTGFISRCSGRLLLVIYWNISEFHKNCGSFRAPIH